MNEPALVFAGAVLVLGFASQWLAWRLRLPSILLLLLAGLLAGPVVGYVDTDELMGDLLFPFVSLSVAVILFEGGLSLRFSELRGVKGVLGKLIFVGGICSWGVSYLAARYLLGLDAGLALLLGAVFVVTGPTVIVPLLRHVRPKGKVGALMKWEGIVNDPIGATLALLVFEGLVASTAADARGAVAGVLLRTVVIGGVLGAGAAWALVRLFVRHTVPDFLHNPFSLTAVISVFVISDHFQSESGLLAVTVMGIVLANQSRVGIRHIVEFKENLRVLLISVLFVLLAARITPSELALLDLKAFAFVAALMLIGRPLGVWLATIGSEMNWKERLFLSWMAPRGIVAMAVISLFALRLEDAGVPGGTGLVPVTFLLVVLTVAIYGLSAAPLARKLGIASQKANGVLLVGASAWARELARVLGELEIPVLLVDTNRVAVRTARMAGLTALTANPLVDNVSDRLDLSDVGSVLAMTPNDEVNALVSMHFSEWFGRSNVYQLEDSEAAHRGEDDHSPAPGDLGGRLLFGEAGTFWKLERRLGSGAEIRRTSLTAEFDFTKYVELHGEKATPLILLQADGDVFPWATEGVPQPKPGDVVIALVDPEGE